MTPTEREQLRAAAATRVRYLSALAESCKASGGSLQAVEISGHPIDHALGASYGGSQRVVSADLAELALLRQARLLSEAARAIRWVAEGAVRNDMLVSTDAQTQADAENTPKAPQ